MKCLCSVDGAPPFLWGWGNTTIVNDGVVKSLLGLSNRVVMGIERQRHS